MIYCNVAEIAEVVGIGVFSGISQNIAMVGVWMNGISVAFIFKIYRDILYLCR